MTATTEYPEAAGADGERPAWAHPTSIVEPGADIGAGTRIWANAQVRSGARIGTGCILGRNSFVDAHVIVGDNVKIHTNASVFEGAVIDDGVFIGPHVVITNDRIPRAINPDGSLKTADDWVLGHSRVSYGAALGAGAIVVTGVTIGRWALVGSGAVVTTDVPDHGLVVGNPARLIGWVSATGVRCDSQDAARQLTEAEANNTDAGNGGGDTA
jgi:UDP-2-acetamido-3-amino-2,3-dideoxy-glucuronate N-acetyltransferase